MGAPALCVGGFIFHQPQTFYRLAIAKPIALISFICHWSFVIVNYLVFPLINKFRTETNWSSNKLVKYIMFALKVKFLDYIKKHFIPDKRITISLGSK